MRAPRASMRHQPLERRSMKPDAERGLQRASPAARRRARRSRATDARSTRPARDARRGCRPRHARTDRRRRAPPSDGRGGAARRSASNGTGHGWPRPSTPASFRCRSPPNTVSALGKRLSACLRQPGKAIFADTDDGQPGTQPWRALILGGTGDANLLAAAFARARIDAIYSYAGRTQIPLPISRCRPASAASAARRACRLHPAAKRITHVIDATHPFAAEMSRHAVEACAATDTPLIALERAPWTQCARRQLDRGAQTSTPRSPPCPTAPARVFLAIGRQHIAPFAAKPQHAYTLRFVDAPEAPCRCPMPK